MLRFADRTLEQISAPSGSGAFVLSSVGQWQSGSGIVGGMQTWANIGLAIGDMAYYTATDTVGNAEVGLGQWLPYQLSRITILTSSANGGYCSFAGTTTVYCVFPAEVYGPLGIKASGLAASATSQASAATPPAGLSVYSTVSASAGVVLPSGAYQTYTIANASTGALSVWPASGGAIGALATNAPATLYPNTAASFWIATSGQVYVVG